MAQKKWKFNIVDLLIILILIAGIAFIGMKVLGNNDSGDAISTTYDVTFFAEEVPEVVAEYLQVGAPATNAERNVDLGTLVDVEIGPAVSFATLEDGTIVQTSKPGYCSIRMVCRLTGTQQSIGLQVGNQVLGVGHTLSVRNGNSKVDCYIAGIEVAGQE